VRKDLKKNINEDGNNIKKLLMKILKIIKLSRKINIWQTLPTAHCQLPTYLKYIINVNYLSFQYTKKYSAL